jgi:hypothetical protein
MTATRPRRSGHASGLLGLVAMAATPTPGPTTPSAPPARVWLLVPLLILVIVILVAVLVPIPLPFSGSVATATPGTPGTNYTASFAKGATVSGSWSASGTQPVALLISSSTGTHVYAGNGSTGSFSFVSNGADYTFTADSFGGEIVSVQGHATETVAEYVENAL